MHNLNKYIAELRAQREKLDVAIEALSALVSGKRRGRPPKWMSERKRAKAVAAGA